MKDGRYKYILSNLNHDAGNVANLRSGGPLEQEKVILLGFTDLSYNRPWQDLKTEATRDVRNLLIELQTAMTLQKPQPVKAASDF